MAFSMMSARRNRSSRDHGNRHGLRRGRIGPLPCERVPAARQRGLVLRVIPTKIRALDELYLPKIVEQVCDMPRGLILVTGVTGSVSLQPWRPWWIGSIPPAPNTSSLSKTPIEFLHRDKKGYVNQREVEVDTPSFGAALRASLRQDPDVILVGEMRDLENDWNRRCTPPKLAHGVLHLAHFGRSGKPSTVLLRSSRRPSRSRSACSWRRCCAP